MTEDETDIVDTVEYNPESEQFRARFDTSPSLAIVEFVALISGEDPVDLDTLTETIDPDALDRLFSAPTSSQREGDIHLRFLYRGYNVNVHSYGVMTAEPTSGMD